MDDLKKRARQLGIRALVAHWDEFAGQPWIKQLLDKEDEERQRRSFERRIREAQIGEFKPLGEFDWAWPRSIDRELIDELMRLDFLKEGLGSNIVFRGANGVGKSMLAKNLAYQALMHGYKTRFVPASQMLSDLAQHDGASARQRCLRKYTTVDLLVIDEVGYLSYANNYADLLYEVLNARYLKKSTIVTTNRVFEEWSEVFPHAACVVTLVDRLTHRADVITIDADSYRNRESIERSALKAKTRKKKKTA
jgi:DNA replication protein DnaC